MPTFRKRPVEIEARLLSAETGIEIAKWCEGEFFPDPVEGGTWGSFLNIYTLEGTMRADIGDWIVKGVKGEFYPVKPDIFEATYESVHDPMVTMDEVFEDNPEAEATEHEWDDLTTDEQEDISGHRHRSRR